VSIMLGKLQITPFEWYQIQNDWCKQEKAKTISATVRELSHEQRRGGHRINPEIQVCVDEGLLLE
jgi:hypothetical protein